MVEAFLSILRVPIREVKRRLTVKAASGVTEANRSSAGWGQRVE